jgi:hypothetical protein
MRRIPMRIEMSVLIFIDLVQVESIRISSTLVHIKPQAASFIPYRPLRISETGLFKLLSESRLHFDGNENGVHVVSFRSQ